ncbi:MAG: flagellar hook capping protein [Candidatus Riflebacteria bacterium]|nr:flagellar hook capping protein [Candidatus Riflebacteria bacterium]
MALEITDVKPLGTSGVKGTPKRELDQDAFLTLLTKQLQNQDPMKPMDNMDFVGQMAQLSSLDQTAKLNTNMTKLLNQSASSYKLQAMSLLGKAVVAQPAGSPDPISNKVDSVMFEDGEAIFQVGGQDLKLDEIVMVS